MPLFVTVPPPEILTIAVTLVVVPSGSMLFAVTFVITAVPLSSVVEVNSFPWLGESFTGETVIVKVWVTQRAGNGNPWSQIVTVIISVPLKFEFGV